MIFPFFKVSLVLLPLATGMRPHELTLAIVLILCKMAMVLLTPRLVEVDPILNISLLLALPVLHILFPVALVHRFVQVDLLAEALSLASHEFSFVEIPV